MRGGLSNTSYSGDKTFSEVGYSKSYSADRASFVVNEISNHNSCVDEATLTAKYEKMKESPFAFYRATAHLFYKDINNGVINIPNSWEEFEKSKTWIQGDFHIQNLGYFEDKNGEIVFDLNDFDESITAAFYYDLIRFVTSIYLVKKILPFDPNNDDMDSFAEYFLEKYQDYVLGCIGNNNELGYTLDKGNTTGFVHDTIKDLEDNQSVKKMLDKWTVINNGTRKFDLSNIKLAEVDTYTEDQIKDNWNEYLSSLDSLPNSSQCYFDIKDIAVRKLSGLGSLGVEKYYILIEGASSENDDDVLLELKEQNLPSIIKYLYTDRSDEYYAKFGNDAVRSKIATKAMLSKVERHLGYMSMMNKHYRLKMISAYKKGYDISDFDTKDDFKNFLKYAAKALAYAHSRSDKDYNEDYVPYSFEKHFKDFIDEKSKVKTKIIDISKDYANIVKDDYHIFLDNF